MKRARTIAENKFGKDHHFIADVLYELGCIYFVKPEELGVTFCIAIYSNITVK